MSTAASTMSPRELTNELKTRLSYAMIKVQKGWESLPLYDLESMASQSESPSSSSGVTLNGRRTSAFGSAFTSPRVALERDHSGLSEHSGRDTLTRDPVVVPDSTDGNGLSNGYSRTYESFWRSQAQRTLTSPSNAQHASLQPPTDLGSAQRPNGYLRRSPSKTSQPQRSGLSQSTSDLSTSSRYSSSSSTMGLQHPPHLPHTPLTHTPSQTPLASNPTQESMSERPQATNPKTQSMQEQDAIETLLFMSSPGNGPLLNFPPPTQSQNPTPSASQNQGSPLKTSFSHPSPNSSQPQTARRPQNRFYEPDERLYAKLSQHRAMKRAQEERRRSGGRLTSEEVERMIDSYRGESSDDEVEIEIPPKRRRSDGERVAVPTSADSA